MHVAIVFYRLGICAGYHHVSNQFGIHKNTVVYEQLHRLHGITIFYLVY